MKAILKYIKYVTISLTILFIVCETVTRFMGFTPAENPYVRVEPHNIFEVDSILGWKLGNGKFKLTVLDTSNTFIANINNQGDRVTSSPNTPPLTSQRPAIHIYGCSFTFGFSLNDSATLSYKLQRMMPEYEIKNKGVPGYGLTQMYLSLKKSLIAKDTPRIAVFNYAFFHDDRTPLCREWNIRFGFAISQSYSNKFRNMNYPYMRLVEDTLMLCYQSFDNPLKNWIFANKSSFVNLLNTFYNLRIDEKNAEERHLIALKTAIEIVSFCKENKIIPIFTNVTAEFEKKTFFETLYKNGSYILNYGVPIMTVNEKELLTTIYNCGPFDPGHPSGLANTIYAQKLFQFINDSIPIKY